MRKGFIVKRGLLFSLLLFLFLASCKEPGDFGLDTQPSSDLLETTYQDTFTLNAYTVRDDSIYTNEVYYNLMGSCIDPVFGASHAGFYSHFLLPESNVDFGSNPVLDSMFLCLDYVGYYYGLNTPNEIPVRVYEVLEDFSIDSVYYSYTELLKDATPLVQTYITPNLEDSVVVNNISYAPHLRISLPVIWGQKFLDESGNTTLENNENFLSFFKGLYVDAAPLFIGKPGGSILQFNLISSLSNITLYYHNDTDTADYNFVIDEDAARFNVFDHNAYVESHLDLQNQLMGNTTSAEDILFLQAMAGTKIKIELPYIENLSKTAINKAELIVPIDQTTSDIDNYVPPQALSLVKVDKDGEYQFLQDQTANSSTFGGQYDESKKEYRFLISRYIQDLILGKEDNYGLYLLVSGNAINASRIVINGDNKDPGIRIAISYTKID